MAHARKTVRDALTTAVTGLTTTGANVYQSRVYPIEAAGLPGLLVFAEADRVVDSTLNGNRTLYRQTTFVVEAHAKATSALDDTLDLICEEVEVALAADPTLGGVCTDLQIRDTELAYEPGGDQPHGTARMQWECAYFVKEQAPGSAL